MKVSAIVYLTDERNGNTLEVKIELPPTNELYMREQYELNSLHEIDRRTTAVMLDFVNKMFAVPVEIVNKRQLHGG
jgi:hypothetical protein